MHRSSPSFATVPTARNTAKWRWRLTPWLAVGALCLLGALTLAGCGVTVNVGGDSGGSQPGATPGGAGGGKTSARPCPGDSVALAKSPTIVLTATDSYKTTQAHVGDVIEVQLDAKTRWSASTRVATSALTALQPQGGMDEQSQTCRWLYEATAAGTASLNFIGSPLCESGVACPAIARAEQFTIQVS